MLDLLGFLKNQNIDFILDKIANNNKFMEALGKEVAKEIIKHCEINVKIKDK